MPGKSNEQVEELREPGEPTEEQAGAAVEQAAEQAGERTGEHAGASSELSELSASNELSASSASNELSASSASGEPSQPAKPPVSAADRLKFIGLVAFFVIVVVIGSAIAVVVVNSLGGEQSLEAELTEAIRGAGFFGILICVGIQFLQVVVAFIPGEVAQLAIGYVYGTLGGALITLVGVLISTIFVFYLTRKLGAPFVQGMIGSKDSGRLRFLRNSRNLNALVLILYLIPGLPKDLFNYVFPLTDIRPRTFFILSTVARAPAIFASTFVAESFKAGNYLGMAIVAIIFGGLGLVGILFNQRIMAFIDRLLPHRRNKGDR